MSANGHTPGPWHIGRRYQSNICIETRSKAMADRCVAVVSPRVDGTRPEAVATATLIAAAPTLLAVLEALLEARRSGHPVALDRAERAAEGLVAELRGEAKKVEEDVDAVP